MAVPADDIGGSQALIASLRADRDAALAVQAALAGGMGGINRDPGNLAQALNTILTAVLRLSDSAFGALQSYDAGVARVIARQGMADPRVPNAIPVDPGTLMHRIVQGEEIVWLADIRDDDAYRAGAPS